MADFLSLREAARRLGVAPNTLINWHKRNFIPGMWRETGPAQRYRVPTEWVNRNIPEVRYQQALGERQE